MYLSLPLLDFYVSLSTFTVPYFQSSSFSSQPPRSRQRLIPQPLHNANVFRLAIFCATNRLSHPAFSLSFKPRESKLFVQVGAKISLELLKHVQASLAPQTLRRAKGLLAITLRVLACKLAVCGPIQFSF